MPTVKVSVVFSYLYHGTSGFDKFTQTKQHNTIVPPIIKIRWICYLKQNEKGKKKVEILYLNGIIRDQTRLLSIERTCLSFLCKCPSNRSSPMPSALSSLKFVNERNWERGAKERDLGEAEVAASDGGDRGRRPR